ncbi:MAG: ATP-binding protein [Candidatus Nanopelagicales bacterium]
MASCSLTIPPETEQVRLARLVACAAARRLGVSEQEVDEVRLAVGEAVGRAVVRHQRAGKTEPVTVRIVDDVHSLSVDVVDRVAGRDDGDFGLAEAVITGLVPGAELHDSAEGGSVLRMSWRI